MSVITLKKDKVGKFIPATEAEISKALKGATNDKPRALLKKPIRESMCGLKAALEGAQMSQDVTLEDMGL